MGKYGFVYGNVFFFFYIFENMIEREHGSWSPKCWCFNLKVQLGVPLEQYMYLAFGTAHHNIHKFRYYSLRIKV